jgi:branched-chain amino acid transport system permease protein
MYKQSNYLWFVLISFLILIPHIIRSEYYQHLLIISGIYILLALGLNLIIGYTGQVSLAHAAFYGIGAYTAAILSVRFDSPFWFNIFAAAFMAGLFGILLGVPTIRLAGHYLGIATLTFGIIIEQIFLNWISLTRGPMGITGIKPPRINFLNFEFSKKIHYYYLIFTIVLIVLILFRRLISYRTGRAFAAIRENEISAKAMGINTIYYKVLAFTIAAMIAGVAGCFFAHYILFVSPDSFGFLESINILALTIIGGTGNILGSLIGGLFLTIVPEFLRALQEAREVIYGALLLLIVIFMPRGLSGFILELKHRWTYKEK